MSDQQHDRPNLKQFDPAADRNGQDLGADSPLDIGIPSRTQADLRRESNGEAQAARIASGTPGEDASDQTAAETPPENLSRIGGAGSSTSSGGNEPSGEAAEAIERATAVVGDDEDAAEDSAS